MSIKQSTIQFTGRTLILMVLAVLVIGALGGWVVSAVSGRSPFGWGNGVPIMVASSVPVSPGGLSFAQGFAPVVEKVRPAVVNIASIKIVRSQGGPNSPLFNDPFFRQFFGNVPQRPSVQRENSLGSGVIISPDGYVLTNNHVIEGASDIEVTLSDKRVFKAKLIGTDPKTDIAVVKLDTTNLPVMVLGNSNDVKVGNFVLAAGDPFGLGQTFTMGIVSATGRNGMGIERYENFIQTDAAINPGNSGGPLVDVEGELIGINTAIVAGNGGGNEGIGFAIPINMAQNVMSQLIKTGHVVRGYLGVEVQALTPSLASAFGLKRNQGALVSDVSPNTPAAQAGLQRGDVVVSLNGTPINDSSDLSLKIAEMPPGTTVQLSVWRNGAERQVSVKLGEMPAQQEASAQQGIGTGSVLQGLSVDNLTPQIAGQLGLPADTKGVVVAQVQPGSAASEAGLQQGDVIQEVNHTPVANTDDFERAERQAGKQPVVLLINRGGTTLYVAVGQ